jgi:ATP-dependent Clp protease adaptor protein ClpS
MTHRPSSGTAPVGSSVANPAVKPAMSVAPPRVPRYRVLIHNDPVTPMDFVVDVLTSIFKKVLPDAYTIMMEAHNRDVALVDVMGLEEAEFRVEQAHALARTAKFPLTFTIEPE